jgi:FkbM family methyltransferase
MKFPKNRIKRFKIYYNHYKQFGFTFINSFLAGRKQKTVYLFNCLIEYTDRFWLLHGLQEIFIDQVYAFKSVSHSPRIIDCGSNIGLSVIFFKRTFPQSRITAFEPDKRNFEILNKNLNAFQFKDIELVNKAIWKENAVLRFNSFASVGSKLSSSQDSTSHNTIAVEAVALSNYLKEPIDFLKIDIEGAEYEVLSSCEPYLKNVNHIFIEYHSFPGESQVLSDLLKILTNAGFRYYIRQAWEQFKYPYIHRETKMFDLQLNIFGYRD